MRGGGGEGGGMGGGVRKSEDEEVQKMPQANIKAPTENRTRAPASAAGVCQENRHANRYTTRRPAYFPPQTGKHVTTHSVNKNVTTDQAKGNHCLSSSRLQL